MDEELVDGALDSDQPKVAVSELIADLKLRGLPRAVTTVQASYRGRAVRRQAAEQTRRRNERSAALCLQALHRGGMAREMAREMGAMRSEAPNCAAATMTVFKTQRTAAAVINRAARSFLMRLHFSAEWLAATFAKDWETRSHAATVINRTIRGFLARLRFTATSRAQTSAEDGSAPLRSTPPEQRLNAAERQQARQVAKQARELLKLLDPEMVAKLEGVERLQACVRRWLVMRQASLSASRMLWNMVVEGSATRIQAAVRGRQSRRSCGVAGGQAAAPVARPRIGDGDQDAPHGAAAAAGSKPNATPDIDSLQAKLAAHQARIAQLNARLAS